jgi:hypothetical protein
LSLANCAPAEPKIGFLIVWGLAQIHEAAAVKPGVLLVDQMVARDRQNQHYELSCFSFAKVSLEKHAMASNP